MATFVVLLRGVNVGRGKRVPMADFKALLLDLGCHRATTLLNSGNAVIELPRAGTKALSTRIGDAIAARFGFEVPVIVKTGAELDRIVAANPLTVPEPEHARLLVVVAPDARALASLRELSGLVAPPERLFIGDEAAFLHCAAGILESKAAKALLGPAGRAVTTRNWATVLKLQALAAKERH